MATAGDCAGDAASMRAAFDLCVDVSVTTEELMASVVRALEQRFSPSPGIYAMRLTGPGCELCDPLPSSHEHQKIVANDNANAWY